MSAPKLIRPSLDYKDSFLEALEEYRADGQYKYLDVGRLRSNFEGFVDSIIRDKKHPGQTFQDWVEIVPETILWLVHDDRYIGTVTLRHRLNWHLEKNGGHMHIAIRPSERNKGFGLRALRMSLPYANYLGIEKALMTIPPQNKSVIRAVEDMGAEFQDETKPTSQFPARRRYWIDTF